MRRLLNAGWRQRGVYVRNERYQVFPSAAGLVCDTTIRTDFAYKFGLTRTTEGKVSLFLNGWKCAEAYPSYAFGFALNREEDGMEVLHDGDGAYETSGYLRRVQMWGSALSDAQVAVESDCALPTVATEQCIEELTFGSQLPRSRSPPADPLTGTSIIREGEALFPGQYLYSGNGAFRALVRKINGRAELVVQLFDSATSLWSDWRVVFNVRCRQRLRQLELQTDGNLVLSCRWAEWTSNTNIRIANKPPQFHLDMQSDGNLCVYSRNSYVMWCANSARANQENHDAPPLDPYDSVTFSDTLNNDEKGQFWGRGLGVRSGWAWQPLTNNQDFESYAQVDLGLDRTVTKVRTAGFGNDAVTAFILKVSSDGQTWKDVQCNRRFETPWVNGDHVHETPLNPPLKARYVRFIPVSWRGYTRMRFEVVFCRNASERARKAPLSRLRALATQRERLLESRQSVTAAIKSQDIVTRAQIMHENPCSGRKKGCNPCLVQAELPGVPAKCRDDGRCLGSVSSTGVGDRLAKAWKQAIGALGSMTGAATGESSRGAEACRPLLCAEGDQACYNAAFAPAHAGGYPAIDSDEFRCALYNDPHFRPLEGISLRRKCQGDSRCEHKLCGCIGRGARCEHGREVPPTTARVEERVQP